jgi:hypothetical protein
VTSNKKFWKNEYFQTAITIALFAVIILASYVAIASNYIDLVPSGSMCIPYDGTCDGWSHPFDRTLHVGDLLFVLPINPKDLNTNYPDSDIIVFHNPLNPSELIVHRIIGTTEVNGTIYFGTKGDGNGNKWPQLPQSGLDPWDYSDLPGVSQNLLVGKVVIRIPWIGWISIFEKSIQASLNINTYVVLSIGLVLIILLIIIEFVIPLIKSKKTPSKTEKPAQIELRTSKIKQKVEISYPQFHNKLASNNFFNTRRIEQYLLKASGTL